MPLSWAYLPSTSWFWSFWYEVTKKLALHSRPAKLEEPALGLIRMVPESVTGFMIACRMLEKIGPTTKSTLSRSTNALTLDTATSGLSSSSCTITSTSRPPSLLPRLLTASWKPLRSWPPSTAGGPLSVVITPTLSLSCACAGVSASAPAAAAAAVEENLIMVHPPRFLLATFPAPVAKTRGLHAALELLGERAGLQHHDVRGQPEAVLDGLSHPGRDRISVRARPRLDRDEQHLEVARRHQLGLEVGDLDVAEHEVLELRMVD